MYLCVCVSGAAGCDCRGVYDIHANTHVSSQHEHARRQTAAR